MTTTMEHARPETPPTPPAPPGAEPSGLAPRQRTLVLAAMCLALVLVIAGVSMLAVGLPAVGEDLGLSQTSLTWVADAYALTLASLLLLAGALGDRYGRRGALLVGIAIFGAGSLLSSFADSGGQLIAFRALTGIGGALIMPGTLSTITSVFPPEERARAVGIWAGFAGAGGTLGMLAAGGLLGSFSWSSIFVVTAVVSAVTFLAVLAFVPTSRSTEHVGLDPIGTRPLRRRHRLVRARDHRGPDPGLDRTAHHGSPRARRHTRPRRSSGGSCAPSTRSSIPGCSATAASPSDRPRCSCSSWLCSGSSS